MRSYVISLLLIVGFLAPVSYAEYDQDLRYQIEQLQSRHTNLGHLYFHDMGVMARKADEAGYNDLTSEIVGSLLFKKMDAYTTEEFNTINQLYHTNPTKATQRLGDLRRYQRYYQPTAEYLTTTGGQAYSGELARFRGNVSEIIQKECSLFSIRDAINITRKTGLFETKRPEEIRSMQSLMQDLDCCIRWKSKINYYEVKPFESEYEEGVIIEDAQLKLVSSPSRLNKAKWEGEWVYRFEGREGTAEGVSQATLTFEKGKDIATLIISVARVTSAGRINFPIAVSGDRRTVEIEGTPIYPTALLSGSSTIPLAGCEENKVEKIA